MPLTLNANGKTVTVEPVSQGKDANGADIWALKVETAPSSISVAEVNVNDLLTIDEIQSVFCEVFEAVTNLPTIQGDQDGPTPKYNYISLRVVDDESSAHDITEQEFAEDGTSSIETVRGQAYCKLEVQVIGTNAMMIGRRIINSMLHSNRQFDLGRVIGYCGADGPQNLSEVWGGQFRQKALLNIYFYANLSYQTAADFATNGNIEVTVSGLDFEQTFHIGENI